MKYEYTNENTPANNKWYSKETKLNLAIYHMDVMFRLPRYSTGIMENIWSKWQNYHKNSTQDHSSATKLNQLASGGIFTHIQTANVTSEYLKP
jgi:hypothetical protein